MRTGLITFHFAHHYGAQLQALATMRAIQSLGHDCEIIDYRLPHTTRTNQLFKKSGGVRGMASDAHTALHYGAFQRRFRRFEAFVAEEMALSPRRYTAFEQLRADPPAYDVYVAGSDQIWNPYIFQDKQFDPPFLLGFVREGRRIAYAPSLGVPELPEDKAEELRRFLTPFSALSVREKRGQVLLREAAGRDARVVLAPTPGVFGPVPARLRRGDQLLPRGGLLPPVPEGLLHLHVPQGAGGAHLLPHLQPALPAGLCRPHPGPGHHRPGGRPHRLRRGVRDAGGRPGRLPVLSGGRHRGRPPARGGAGAPGRPPSGAVQGGGLHRLHRLCVGLPGERHCHGARP